MSVVKIALVVNSDICSNNFTTIQYHTSVSPEGSVEATPTIIYGNQSGNATFSCFAMGGPHNVFSWTHIRSNTFIINDSELALVDLMASNGGQYRCLVENPAGQDNTVVTLNGIFW